MDKKQTWVVYCHTCILNNKKYIGITTQKPEYRWGHGSGYKKASQPCFAAAIKKYGWENFIHEILEANIDTLEQANEREQYWIAYYHTWIQDPLCNGYNLTKGGDGTSGHVVSQETRLKLSAAHKGRPYKNSNLELTRKKISEAKKICGNGHKGKRYINNGKECYCVYPEELDSWFQKGFVLGKIYSKKGLNAIEQSSKKIYCVELNKVFNSLSEAASELNLKISKISLCCNGKRSHTGGYHFNFVDESLNVIQSSYIKQKVGKKPQKVHCIELDLVFNSTQEASEALKIPKTNIIKCCSKQRKTAGGYHWVYLTKEDKD